MNKRGNFVIGIAILFFFLLGYLALPQFSIRVGETVIDITGLNLKLLFKDSNLGDFKRGEGIFPTIVKTIKVNVDLTGDTNLQLELFLKMVKERIDYSGLYQIGVEGKIVGNEYFVLLEFPEYFSEIEYISNLLLAPGSISFSPDPRTDENSTETTPKEPVTLKDYDIEGSINSDYLDQLNGVPIGNHLVFKFKDSALEEFNKAMLNNNGLIIMNIDSLPAFSIIRHDSQSEYVRAIPNNFFTDNNQKNIYLNITKTYFLSNAPLTLSTQPVEGTQIISPVYGRDGATFIAVSFIITAALLGIAVLIKRNLTYTITFTLMAGTYIFLNVVILKLFGATLSIYTVIGFIAVYLLGVFNAVELLEENTITVKEKLWRFRNIGLFILFLSAALFQLTNISWAYDILSVLLVGGFSLLTVNSLNFKALIKIYLNK